MNLLIFALVIAFVVANIYVEYINRETRHWWAQPLSAYLSHVRGWGWQQAGYYGLTVALALMAVQDTSGHLTTGLCALAALGLVVLTAVRLPWIPRTQALTRLHVGSAGVAFVAMTVYECLWLWSTPDIWLPLAGVLSAGALALWAPTRHSLIEKAYTACLLAGIVSIVGAPL